MSYKSTLRKNNRQYEWQPKPKSPNAIISRVDFTSVKDTDTEILLRLDLDTLVNLTINKHLYGLINNAAFWCKWLNFHYGSTTQDDCEFLAKISTKELFKSTTHVLKQLLDFSLNDLYNVDSYGVGATNTGAPKHIQVIVKKLIHTTIFWQMWIAQHTIDEIDVDFAVVSPFLPLKEILLNLHLITESYIDGCKVASDLIGLVEELNTLKQNYYDTHMTTILFNFDTADIPFILPDIFNEKINSNDIIANHYDNLSQLEFTFDHHKNVNIVYNVLNDYEVSGKFNGKEAMITLCRIFQHYPNIIAYDAYRHPYNNINAIKNDLKYIKIPKLRVEMMNRLMYWKNKGY